jgi:rRNA maturation endonuclease Nob1
MTEFNCGSCREVFVLSPRAKFCPECGSSSLNLVIKELTEPAQKETLGVYSPSDEKEEEDQPRRRRR